MDFTQLYFSLNRGRIFLEISSLMRTKKHSRIFCSCCLCSHHCAELSQICSGSGRLLRHWPGALPAAMDFFQHSRQFVNPDIMEFFPKVIFLMNCKLQASEVFSDFLMQIYLQKACSKKYIEVSTLRADTPKYISSFKQIPTRSFVCLSINFVNLHRKVRDLTRCI